MGLSEVRKLCHRRLAARRGRGDDDRETLHQCPACEGRGMLKLKTGTTRHRSVSCPWCDGSGFTDLLMTAFWNEYKKAGGDREKVDEILARIRREVDGHPRR